MRGEKSSERGRLKTQQDETMKEESSSAGDEVMPDGAQNEPRKAYPKLIRDQYMFDPDVNALEPDDIIVESGCNTIEGQI